MYCFIIFDLFLKGTQKFLTIVDMKGLTFDFQDLDKYILTALLQCKLNRKNSDFQLLFFSLNLSSNSIIW